MRRKLEGVLPHFLVVDVVREPGAEPTTPELPEARERLGGPDVEEQRRRPVEPRRPRFEVSLLAIVRQCHPVWHQLVDRSHVGACLGEPSFDIGAHLRLRQARVLPPSTSTATRGSDDHVVGNVVQDGIVEEPGIPEEEPVVDVRQIPGHPRSKVVLSPSEMSGQLLSPAANAFCIAGSRARSQVVADETSIIVCLD